MILNKENIDDNMNEDYSIYNLPNPSYPLWKMATSEQIEAAYTESEEENLFYLLSIEELGLDALDMEHGLYGSYIDYDEDVVYLLDPNEVKRYYNKFKKDTIDIDGREIVIEDAMEVVGPAKLINYIVPATNKDCVRIIGEDIKLLNLNEAAIKLLVDWNEDFTDVMAAAKEAYYLYDI